YMAVQSGTGQTTALKAALASSQSALEANQLGYEVGVRINIDVLNAQTNVFATQATLAKARFAVLVGGLQVRQAAGTLTMDHVVALNQLLEQ
ncbi:MAG: TolC family protein, partial [Burkholderiaceae bacterium]